MNDDDIGQLITSSNPVPVSDHRRRSEITSAESELCEAIMCLPTLTSADRTPSDEPTATSSHVGSHDRHRRSRHQRRRWALIGGGAIAAAVAAALVLALPGGSRPNVAFAEWVATPQPVTADERAAILSACQDSRSDFDMSSLNDQTLIDRRGSIAALTAVDGEVHLTCATHFHDGAWYSFGADVESGGDMSQPSLMRGWNSDGAEINVVDGVAAGAARVEVDAPDLPTATATVVDGHYIVWLPQSFDWTERTSGIQVRYLDESGQILQSFEL